MSHEHDRPRVLSRRALLDEHVGDLRPSRMVDDHRVDTDSPQLVGEVVHSVGPDVPKAAQKIDARRLRRSPALPPGLSGFRPSALGRPLAYAARLRVDAIEAAPPCANPSCARTNGASASAKARQKTRFGMESPNPKLGHSRHLFGAAVNGPGHSSRE